MSKISIPSRKKQLSYLEEMYELQKKESVSEYDRTCLFHHCKNVGTIAAKLAGPLQLNVEMAQAMGTLHDIGRRFRERTHQRHHSVTGYKFMKQEGFDEIARICITHCFPVHDLGGYWGIETYFNKQDDFDLTQKVLDQTIYDDYDHLIQLSDMLAVHCDFVTLEKRFEDIQKRYHITDFKGWKAREQRIFELKQDVENRINQPLYDFLKIK